MYKLVVSDIDFTLVETGKDISQKNVETIKKLQENGIKFTLASGRHSNLMKKLYDILNIDIFAISSNGSVINNPMTGEFIKKDIIKNDIVFKAIEVAEELDAQIIIYTNEFAISKLNQRIRFLDKLNTRLEPVYNIPYKCIDDEDNLKNYVDNNIVKILILERDDLEKFHKVYNTLKKLQSIEDMEFSSNGNGLIVISAFGSNKGEAIKYLANYYGIDLKDIIAFGDEENDINMLKEVGLGIAMGNATDELKAVADYVTDEVYEDGFSSAIEKFVFKKNNL